MRFGFALLLAAAGLAGADGGPDAVLARLRARLLSEAARIPNYTCVQTVDRQFSAAPPSSVPGSCGGLSVERSKPGFRMVPYGSDRFRLDVGVGPAREVYSWAGAERFEDRDLGDLIPGPASTGTFATLLHMMFSGDAAEFVYRGQRTLERRRLLAYSFRVPAARSHYFLRGAQGYRKAAAYHGTILADPDTGDLARLDIQIDDSAPEANLCEFSAELDYSRMRIGAADFLLPKAARQRFVMPSRMEAENTVAFSGCREFKAESAIKYGDPADAQPPGGKDAASRQPPRIPAGLPLSVESTSGIDSDAAAAGDAYSGRLAEPLLDASNNTLAPRGATVHGRIMRAEHYHYPPSVQIELALETVEIGGAALPIRVAAKRAGSGARAQKASPAPRSLLPYSFETDWVVIQLPGDHALLPPGYRTEWVTSEP
jgi:hypothetical protein